MTHGEGPRKWDVDGNEYVDYVSGHGALLLGHSHPAIAEAVSKQMLRGTHLGASTDEEMRWAKAIQALMPSVEKVRFHSSGTEATLMAMRLARAFSGKSKIIKLQDHFHGWHDYAMAGSDRSSPGIPETAWESMVIVPSGDLSAVEDVLGRNDDIAALILEPTGAHYGQLPFDTPNYLKGLRELTLQQGVVLIFDEVVTGFRASPGGTQGRFGVTPDLTTLAKIVAGGLPGGAVGGKAEIIDMIAHRGDPEWDNTHRVYHPGTFTMRLARAFSGKSKVIKLQDHFHGWHDYAMAGSDRSSPGIPETAWESMVIVPSGDLSAVEDVLGRNDDIAALILEPTGAHYGQLPFDTPNYLKGLRELTLQQGVVLIFDEVVTGFRASPGGTQGRFGVTPDLTTLAKIVAGGLPGGAVGGKAEIIDMIAHRGDPEWDNTHRVYHPGTFNANPLSAVAGATALEMIASQPINQQADAMAARLKKGLNELFGKMEVAGHAHGIASMIHVVLADCDCDREICTMPHSKIKETVGSSATTGLKWGLQNMGVDIMGREAFLVSATHTEREIDETLDAFQNTLAAMRSEGLV